jgi:DNA-binding Xre family transcriptional regulator
LVLYSHYGKISYTLLKDGKIERRIVMMLARGTNPMAVKMAVRKLIARENMRRAETGEPVLTQRELERLSGVSQSVISTLMSGNIKRIDLKTINGLCNFFKVRPGDLFDYEPDEPFI